MELQWFTASTAGTVVCNGAVSKALGTYLLCPLATVAVTIGKSIGTSAEKSYPQTRHKVPSGPAFYTTPE
jgi:hypothetical protein